MTIKNKKEIEKLREGGKILAGILEKIKDEARAGTTSQKLNEIAEKEILVFGGRPSFKNYKISNDEPPFPSALCVSINDEIVHGIPSERVLKKGDLVSLDIGMEYLGLFTDMAITVYVDDVDKKTKKILETGKRALEIGISQIHDGAHVGDIGHAIQFFCEKEGFNIVRKLVGHGVGYAVHEDPEIPNWGERGKGIILKEGMVIAIEPMITEGFYDIKLMPNRWTWATKDGSRAVHFEHTVVVTKNGAEILTLR
ncbi:MAG: type I methionyl aminopeptidase [Candidatus Niyogibacteria bacterium CG10_big_fil_rev_8_21_14_0_10_42_19]|uniref:Methionine aminopeptidase n=1 Tax=Candidatus Niyogibacteria bacterium CG10_big_fil_rev_8_21_14_0_10_42_19 TaxID=1974725 RepID=A0A2H0TFE3_9BACT|nr:MAG: type I methionyl aminopeptidase [Candidatus Niyogibacteria bacterium CG10_big_fil_rev_8_21_14_0_10_42_19]